MAEPVDTNGAPTLGDYEKLIQEFEIQPDTVAKLEKLGITSLRSFSLLTPELVDSNLADVSLGQRLLVKAAIESGGRLRQRQQQQDESMGKATVPTFTFDSSHQPPGTRYVVSVTTKDNQVVALPVTKETYEKCFLKGEEDTDYVHTVTHRKRPRRQQRQSTSKRKKQAHSSQEQTSSQSTPQSSQQSLQVFNPPATMEQATSSNHVLQRIPPRDFNKHPQKRCTVCREKGIRRDSRYYCPGCVGQPGFCRVNDCFAEYHHTVFGSGVLVVQNE